VFLKDLLQKPCFHGCVMGEHMDRTDPILENSGPIPGIGAVLYIGSMHY
jgi:hypothetical protein